MAIDVGNNCDAAAGSNTGYGTVINDINVANADGVIDYVCIRLNAASATIDFASFTNEGGDTFSTNGTATGLSGVSGLNEFNAPGDFTAFNISTGDYIGAYCIRVAYAAVSGAWWLNSDQVPCTSQEFGTLTRLYKLYATGTESGGEIVQIGNATMSLVGSSLVVNARTELSIGNASIALAGSTLSVNAKTQVGIDPGTIALTGSALNVNAKTSIPITNGTISLTGSDLIVLAGETVQIPNATISLVGSDLVVDEGNIISINAASIAVVGSSLIVNAKEDVPITAGSIYLVGSTLNINMQEIVPISNAAIALAGAALKVNEILKIGNATVTVVGSTLHIAGEITRTTFQKTRDFLIGIF